MFAMFSSSPPPLFPLLFYLDQLKKNQSLQADGMKSCIRAQAKINGLTVVVYSYGIIYMNVSWFFFVLK